MLEEPPYAACGRVAFTTIAFVAADDVAVADFDLAAVVGIDSVAVRDIQFVADRHSVHEDAFTSDEMKRPVRRVQKRDPDHGEIATAGEHGESWPEGGWHPPFAARS